MERCCFLGFVGLVRPVICGAISVLCIMHWQEGKSRQDFHMLKSAARQLFGRTRHSTRSCLPRSKPARISYPPSKKSILCTRPSPFTMSDKKPEPKPESKELSDEYILAAIAKESKEFDKVRLLLYSSLISNLTNHSHPRTPKSTASSKPSVSTPMPSSTCSPVYPTTTSRNAIA